MSNEHDDGLTHHRAQIAAAGRAALSDVAGNDAQATRRAACLQALIRLLLLFGGDLRLTGIAALPYPGAGDEFRVAAAALLGHRLLQWEDPRLFGQQMGIMEVAMIHSGTTFR